MFKVGDIVKLTDFGLEKYYRHDKKEISYINNKIWIIHRISDSYICVHDIYDEHVTDVINSSYIELDIQYTRKQKLKKLLECSK